MQAGQDIFTAMAARLFGVAAAADVKDALVLAPTLTLT